MKKLITVSALTRCEYSVVVEVPDGTSDDELEELAEQIYQDTDGGEYVSDPEYWERGSQTVDNADDDDKVNLRYRKSPEGYWKKVKQKG